MTQNPNSWHILSPWQITGDMEGVTGIPIRVGSPAGTSVHVQTQADFDNLPSEIQERWEVFENAEDEEVFIGVWGKMDPHFWEGTLISVNEEEWVVEFQDGERRTYHINDDGIYNTDPEEEYPEEDWTLFAIQWKDHP